MLTAARFAVPALVFAACTGQTLKVSTDQGGASPPTPDAASNTPVTSMQCAAGVEGGAAVSGDVETDTTIDVATCAGGNADVCATLGVGLVGLAPTECSAAAGPVHAVQSVADVTALLPATWYSCDGSVFGIDVPTGVGVEFMSDGHYAILAPDDQNALVTASVVTAADAGGTGVATSGTYAVVDGSATYGPGAFELQLRPAGGGLSRGQIVVHDSPRQFEYFAPNANGSVFSLAAPWTPRAGVCSCVQAVGSKVSPNDPTALAAAMTGRWVWCGGLPPSFGGIGGLLMGIEFTSDGSWYPLQEDVAGNLTRGPGGTFQLDARDSGPPFPTLGPEPLTLALRQAAQSTLTQVAVSEGPRALLLSVETRAMSVGASNVYSVLFPAP